METEKNIYDFSVKDAQGQTINMSKYKGKVVLIVNVASKCGFTPQYEGLEALYKEFKDRDFVILGFPCNQFGNQEPGTNSEIQQFCTLTFNVSFPVMAKVDVNGPDVDPLFGHLKKMAPGFLGTQIIKWNFTKFLIGRDGHVIARYAPNTEPKDIITDIKKAL